MACCTAPERIPRPAKKRIKVEDVQDDIPRCNCGCTMYQRCIRHEHFDKTFSLDAEGECMACKVSSGPKRCHTCRCCESSLCIRPCVTCCKRNRDPRYAGYVMPEGTPFVTAFPASSQKHKTCVRCKNYERRRLQVRRAKTEFRIRNGTKGQEVWRTLDFQTQRRALEVFSDMYIKVQTQGGAPHTLLVKLLDKAAEAMSWKGTHTALRAVWHVYYRSKACGDILGLKPPPSLTPYPRKRRRVATSQEVVMNLRNRVFELQSTVVEKLLAQRKDAADRARPASVPHAALHNSQVDNLLTPIDRVHMAHAPRTAPHMPHTIGSYGRQYVEHRNAPMHSRPYAYF